MTQALSIQLLGEFAVLRGGVPLALPQSKKTKALLAYLALAERPQRREFLCEMFWDLPDDPRASLRWSLSKIRQMLEDGDAECLAAGRESIQLRRDHVEIDAAAIKHIKPSSIADRSTAELETIAATLRGSFLADLSLPRCPGYEAWRAALANEFETLRLATLRVLIDRLAAADPARALDHAHALQQLFPEDASLPPVIKSLVASVRKQHASGSSGADRGTAPPTVSGSAAPDLASVPYQEIRYCSAPDGVRLAYATVGQGPVMVRAPHWMTHLEYDWDSPIWRPWIQELSSAYRLIRFDQRCNGLSERGVAEVSFEAMVKDLETVIDAAGIDRFVLLGVSQGCAVSVAYAAKHPERVRALVLCGGYVRGWRARGDKNEIARREAMGVLIHQGWGLDAPMFRQLFTSMFIPLATPGQMSWYNDLQRHTATVNDAYRLQAAMADIDVHDLLAQVRAPTLVLHTKGDLAVPIAQGRAFASGIAGAQFVELPSTNHILLEGEPAFAEFFARVRSFLTETLGEPG